MAITHPSFPSYVQAEKYCDEWAGDTEQHIVVVEDFETDELYVMTADDAEEFLETHDAEIQYDADYRRSDKCACGYRAEDADDLESHILSMSRISDNSTHAEARP